MKIAGSGSIAGGDYNEEITVAGSGKIIGNVKCLELKASGALKSNGDIVSEGELKSSGAFVASGSISAKSIISSGTMKADGMIFAEEYIKSSGNIATESDIKCAELSIDGNIKVGGGIEAESVRISGNVECAGLLNAEKIEIALGGSDNKIGSIGGSEINIHPGKRASFVNKNSFFQKLVGGLLGKVTVEEDIEGDVIGLEYVKAPAVIGRVVKIGPGCDIDTVKYTEELVVSTSAKVGSSEKI